MSEQGVSFSFWKASRVGLLIAAVAILSGCGGRTPGSGAAASAGAPMQTGDLELTGMQLGSSDGGKTYDVSGQVQNHSQTAQVSEVQLKLVLQDCLVTGDCEDIAEDTPTVHLDVPPGQTRPFELHPNLKESRPPQGQLGWRYSIIAAKGSASGPA